MVTDIISCMLVDIKNHTLAGRADLEVPFSKTNVSIAKILEREGYLSKVHIKDADKKQFIELSLGDKKLLDVKRVSRPGRRYYAKNNEIPRPKGGAGFVIISTNSGIMTGHEARKKGLGGEVICEVF